jgi:hypothetical protein
MALLHLAVLAAFAVAQPLYDLLGTHPAYLIDMEVGLPAILWLVALLSFALPAALVAILWGAGRLLPRAKTPLFAVSAYSLLALMVLPLEKRLIIHPGEVALGLALAVAAALIAAYSRFGGLRSVVTVASLAIVIFPARFLFHSPITELVFPRKKAAAAGGGAVPVVMVVFDEFCGLTLMNERREIDERRFPHFAELAKNSTWFRNATTVHCDTAQAVPAILSGKYPTDVYSPPDWDRPQNLFSVLESKGYDLAAFEPLTRLAAERRSLAPVGFGRSLEQALSLVPTLATVYLHQLCPVDMQQRLPLIPRVWFGLKGAGHVDRRVHRGLFRYDWGEDRRGQFEHFLDCFDDPGEPTLHFIHLLLPHVHWCYLPSGRAYIADGSDWQRLDFNTHGSMIGLWGTDELFVAQGQQRYLLQCEFVDALVGRLIARLKQTDLYDRSLVVVTADHGVCFRPGQPRRAASAENPADVLSIPLFIKAPGQQSAEISGRNVESVDLLPSVADLLGIRLTEPVDGRSVFGGAPEKPDKTFYDAEIVSRTVPSSIVDSSRAPEELQRRFGPADDPHALYRIGPHAELIGRPLSDLATDGRSPVELELSRAEDVYSDEPQALVPCLFEGRVLARDGVRLELPASLAVAVNGTIQAVTRTYLLDGARDKWTAMISESALHAGNNDIQYFIITGETPGVQLARCRWKRVDPVKQ